MIINKPSDNKRMIQNRSPRGGMMDEAEQRQNTLNRMNNSSSKKSSRNLRKKEQDPRSHVITLFFVFKKNRIYDKETTFKNRSIRYSKKLCKQFRKIWNFPPPYMKL